MRKFSKEKEPSETCRRQMGDVQMVPYWRHTNGRHHRTKLSHHSRPDARDLSTPAVV